jgi:hypothetical protein
MALALVVNSKIPQLIMALALHLVLEPPNGSGFTVCCKKD